MPAGQLGNAIRRLRRLLAGPDGAGTDRELLQRYAADRDEEAFAALVRRHGPMVLGVCRRVLGRASDADDAFQVTFLVLARKAGSVFWHESVANWLYGVAYRTAQKARVGAARRLRHEQAAGAAPAEPMPENPEARELRQVLDEELQQLPAQLRMPLLLCCLQDMTVDEAAQHLGWTFNMVKGRLQRGREMLCRRLQRRGIELSAGVLGTVVTAGAVRAVPAAQVAATAHAAATGSVAGPSAVLLQAVVRTLFWEKAMRSAIVLGAITLVGALGWWTVHAAIGDPGHAPQNTATVPPADLPATKDGLSLAVRTSKKVFAADEPVDMFFTLKNESGKDLFIGDGFLAPKYHEAGPSRHFEVLATVKPRTHLRFWSGQLTEGRASGARRPFLLKPGGTYSGSIRLSAGAANDAQRASRPHEERGGSFEDVTTEKTHTFGTDAHKYSVVLRYQVVKDSHGIWEPPADYQADLLWKGALDSRPVEFEVAAAVAPKLPAELRGQKLLASFVYSGGKRGDQHLIADQIRAELKKAKIDLVDTVYENERDGMAWLYVGYLLLDTGDKDPVETLKQLHFADGGIVFQDGQPKKFLPSAGRVPFRKKGTVPTPYATNGWSGGAAELKRRAEDMARYQKIEGIKIESTSAPGDGSIGFVKIFPVEGKLTLLEVFVKTKTAFGFIEPAEAAGLDQKQLQGVWTVVSLESAGKKAPDEEIKNLQVVFADKQFVLREGNTDREKRAFRLDAAHSPRNIDFLGGADDDSINGQGIYELVGDTLRICWCKGENEPRPTEFATKADTAQLLVQLKRAKVQR